MGWVSLEVQPEAFTEAGGGGGSPIGLTPLPWVSELYYFQRVFMTNAQDQYQY